MRNGYCKRHIKFCFYYKQLVKYKHGQKYVILLETQL